MKITTDHNDANTSFDGERTSGPFTITSEDDSRATIKSGPLTLEVDLIPKGKVGSYRHGSNQYDVIKVGAGPFHNTAVSNNDDLGYVNYVPLINALDQHRAERERREADEAWAVSNKRRAAEVRAQIRELRDELDELEGF